MGTINPKATAARAPQAMIDALEPRRLLAASVVAEFPAGESGSGPDYVRTVGNLNLFFAEAGERGREMWATDGTPAGTIPLTDVARFAYNPVAYKGFVYYFADDALWRTDGSPRGSVRLIGGEHGKPFNFPSGLTVVGDHLLFTDHGSNIIPTTGARLWRTDGTARGTVMLMEAARPASGYIDISAGELVPVGDSSTAVFSLDNGEQGRELWRTDGTAAGTYQLKDLDPWGDGEPRIVARAADHVFFAARSRTLKNADAPFGLWKTDGTVEGTVLVRQSISATGGAAVGNTVFFASDAAGGGTELWKSDGTAAGTALVRDVYPATFDNGARPQGMLTSVSGNLIITNPWPTPTTGPNSSNPSNFTVAGGLLYFTATSRHGRELWCSDGTEAGTQRLTDLVPGSGGAFFSSFAAVGDTLFFAAGLPGTTDEPWSGTIFKSDGTPEGTVPVISGLTSPDRLSSVGGSLFFREDGWRIMRFDDTGVIAGYVFNDTDGDAARDARELGLVGWRVFIDKDGDGIRDRGEPTTFSNSLGRYRLDLLPRGTFNLRVSPPDADWSATTGTVRPTFAAEGRTSFANLGMTDATPALGSIAGNVFDDANLDGAFDTDDDDSAVAGARVFLDGDGDGKWDAAEEPSAVTNAAGAYRIDGIPLGRYGVHVLPPDARPPFHFTSGGGGTRVVVDDADAITSHIGLHFDPGDAVIHGTLFHDGNANGIHDRGEAGFAGLRVYLDANRNRRMDATERSAVSDTTGYYRFTRLKRGTYFVRQVAVPDGEWASTTPPVFVTAIPRSSSRTGAFGYRPHGTASVEGLVFSDANGDGAMSGGEGGAPGWHVYADLDRDGEHDAGEPDTYTGSGGTYALTNLSAGRYLIRFDSPRGSWLFTHGLSEVDVTLRTGQQRRLNAGAVQSGSVAGTIYYDLDGDRTLTGDPVRSGVTVYLDLNHNGLHDPNTDSTTVTDAAGRYHFQNVPPGTFYAVPVAPPGWIVTSGIYDGAVAANSITEFTSMGVSDRLALRGRLFMDGNGDGQYAFAEALRDYTVYIDTDNDGNLDDAETRMQSSPGGAFLFKGVPLGEHVVRFIPRGDDAANNVLPGAVLVTLPHVGIRPNLLHWIAIIAEPRD